MKILHVNVFFEPIKFGGATLVAERLIKVLDKKYDNELLSVVTKPHDCEPYVIKYKASIGESAYIYSIQPASSSLDERDYRNVEFYERVENHVLRSRPDMVHIHCIQSIGAEFIDVLVEKNIPFVITVHDFWWFCHRQFMINVAGKFCQQEAIDYKQCTKQCGGKVGQAFDRSRYLLRQLNKANAVLAVSDYVVDMLVKNGVPQNKVVLNKNGVMRPNVSNVSGLCDRKDKRIVLGFMGGPGVVKGFPVIVEAFRKLPSDAYVLRLFDAGMKAGNSWRQEYMVHSSGLSVEIVDGYNEDTIDEVFAELDILLFPSQWKETFGLTVREALIRMVWVITSDAGGLSGDVIEGVNGNILDFPAAANDLYKTVSKIIADPTLILASTDIADIVVVEQQAAELQKIYENIMMSEKNGS